jgi:hypothetical protein
MARTGASIEIAGEADTRTMLITILVSGAEGRFHAEEEVRGYASPTSSRWSLLYSSRTAPSADIDKRGTTA